MTGLISLDDITSFDGPEPRIRDVILGARLGLAQPLNIRKVVEANRRELGMHGEVFTHHVKTSDKGGRPSLVYYLNEAQALLICMFSRTPKAAEVRKALIEVFQAYRHGQVALPSTVKRMVRPTREQIAEMRRLWAEGAWPLEHLAQRYNMSISGIRNHLKGVERYSARPDPEDDYALFTRDENIYIRNVFAHVGIEPPEGCGYRFVRSTGCTVRILPIPR